ncbi:hypothetical protein BC937DRAFT_87003 [Endogone sp. FLAS-F59071]|nr:hypothetical protein BC937DRAFT_87003 [Endogone sp. FLAS-F59071]|eukprot:RUS12796.1 hypothetical protein BC937DRAFT_87003 [Endogone sp. FLAS-F59071]
MSYDKDKDALMNTFSPLHGHPLQHQLLYNSSPNPTGSPTMHHTPSPSQSPAPPSPSLGSFHNVPLYGAGGLPRFSVPVQLNLAQKLQQQQQQTPLNHAALSHHAALLGQTPQSVTGSLASPASINSGSQPQTLDALSGLSTPTVAPNTPHYQKQLTYAQMSRLAASPHHHARTAAAAARTATNASVSSAVPITDPNNPTKILNGMPSFGDKRKEQQQQQQQIDNGIPVRDTQSTQASWTTLDMGGMGLKNMSRELFRYAFLTILYINHNSLTYLSPEISRLVHLRTLDASGNKLTSVPPELGMLVQLRDLLLFDNGIMVLPNELGTLYQVENLGLEGNPLQEPLKGMLQKEGSQAVIGINCTIQSHHY